MTIRIALALVALPVLLQPQRPAFRSDVDVVRVDVSVMRGRVPVAGLTGDNFRVTDNGVVQKVDSVTLDRVPLDVVLVLDTSSSVAGDELTQLIEAGQQLVRALHPDDLAGLVTCSQQVIVNVPPTTDLTSVSRALGGLHGAGGTSLNDAIHVAMNLQPADASRPVLIVFTDGADNLSWMRPGGLVDEAKKAGVVIHVIELKGDEAQRLRPTSPVLLEQGYLDGVPLLPALTLQTGGRIWSAESSRDLRRLFTEALDEMRARYLLTFTPAGVAREGWHALKVTLRDAHGDVTARPGYFVSPKAP